MQAIELSKPRVIVISDRGNQYSLTVQPINRKQYMKFFEGIVSTSETVEGKQINSYDASSARLELMHSVVSGATGYEMPAELPSDWVKKLPLSHRLAVAEHLMNVGSSVQPDSAPLKLGVESVYLDCIWGADDEGVMRKLTGLAHHFANPTEEHQRRYSRDRSRSRVVGGSRSGKTLWLGAQGTMAALYDELIVSVEGYTFQGLPLDDNAQIVACMDTYHKVAAAEALFSPATANFAEEV